MGAHFTRPAQTDAWAVFESLDSRCPIYRAREVIEAPAPLPWLYRADWLMQACAIAAVVVPVAALLAWVTC